MRFIWDAFYLPSRLLKLSEHLFPLSRSVVKIKSLAWCWAQESNQEVSVPVTLEAKSLPSGASSPVIESVLVNSADTTHNLKSAFKKLVSLQPLSCLPQAVLVTKQWL